MNETIDFGPRNSHIFKQTQGLCFYQPELFHLAPTYNKLTTLTVQDLNKSQNIYDIYGSTNYTSNLNEFILLKNYPIRLIKLFGRILKLEFKDEKGIYMIRIDDSSGTNSIIDVNIKQCNYLGAGCENYPEYGTMVQFVGRLNIKSYERIFEADAIRIIGKYNDLIKEIEIWDRILKERQFLVEQWICEPNQFVIENRSLQVKNGPRQIEGCTSTNQQQQQQQQEQEQQEQDEVQIISTNIINLMTTEQMAGQYVLWMIRNNQSFFKLIQLYKDPHISRMLDRYIQNCGHALKKIELFHNVRHLVQQTGLITISTTQVVNCTRLLNFYHQVEKALSECKRNQTRFNAQHFDFDFNLDFNFDFDLISIFLYDIIDYIGGWSYQGNNIWTSKAEQDIIIID